LRGTAKAAWQKPRFARHDGRAFVCQSGRTSAPIRPQAVQTIRGHKARTGVSSGSQSALMTALWLHNPDRQ
jgi:hypothetical protein